MILRENDCFYAYKVVSIHFTRKTNCFTRKTNGFTLKTLVGAFRVRIHLLRVKQFVFPRETKILLYFNVLFYA